MSNYLKRENRLTGKSEEEIYSLISFLEAPINSIVEEIYLSYLGDILADVVVAEYYQFGHLSGCEIIFISEDGLKDMWELVPGMYMRLTIRQEVKARLKEVYRRWEEARYKRDNPEVRLDASGLS